MADVRGCWGRVRGSSEIRSAEAFVGGGLKPARSRTTPLVRGAIVLEENPLSPH